MKIKKVNLPTVVMSNSHGKANYFGWPSITKLQNGTIAVVASGYRYAHVCPFGKAVISYSYDNGKTYTLPAPVIDTPLDDRDAGALTFGESGLLVTSFNNTIEFQRWEDKTHHSDIEEFRCFSEFIKKSLDMITPEDESKYLGSEFRISHDFGITFGDIHKSPVSSPHGPIKLHDGTILWVGKVFSPDDTYTDEIVIQAHKINLDGTTEYVGSIPTVDVDGERMVMCEPDTVELPNGKLICHIRAQRAKDGKFTYFTTYQSESCDKGATWSRPHRILELLGGAPSHLLLHSSGILISTYGYRERPYGIKAMFSKDNGETWDTGYDIYINGINSDLGYPCSIELEDGSVLTVFYAHEKENEPAVIMQQKWSFESDD